jgi:pimeloyl-ACP methyl ester carboxylesterase
MSVRSLLLASWPRLGPLKPGAWRCWQHPVRKAARALLVAGMMTSTLAGCTSSPPHPSPASVSFPDTPAGRQARWLFSAVAHHPVADAAITAHFDRAYLATLPAPAPAALNASFAGLQRLQLDSITTSTPDALAFVVTVNGTTKLLVELAVDADGLISRLHLQPAGASAPSIPSPPGSTTSTVEGVQQIPIGVGSPPLQGTLTLPAGKGPFPAVVLVSGSGPGDQAETVGPNKPFLDIALGLGARGIASLRYDKRTRDYPQSIDPRTATPTQEYVPDALAAIGQLRHERAVDPDRIFVLGHSQGGTYAPLIAKRAPEVTGIILLAAGAESMGSAMLRQTRYLATLPGRIGATAKAELPDLRREVAEIDDPAKLERDSPGRVLLGGVGPAYYLSALRYDEVATARSIPQPLLLLQGDHDYQCTISNDLDVWVRGLRGREGVTVVRFPKADHLFLDGTGRPTPLEYQEHGHVDPKVIATIASWIDKVDGASAR